MPIDRLDFDNMSETDLAELIAAQVPEGLRIEYKRELYGNRDEDKREALKDISAFTNAFGGHLIIGIEEQNGLPIAIPGISNMNPDDVLLRLEQLVLSGIEPRIQGIRMRAIPLVNNAFCCVLRIPRSWYPPHRVSAQRTNRFWIRNSSGAHEASIEELRTLFTLAASASDQVRQFRQKRVDEIRAQPERHLLQDNNYLILHIVPLAAVSSLWQVDLAAVQQNKQAFPLMYTHHGLSQRFNFEGFILWSRGEQGSGYTQIFRNGIIESTLNSIVRVSEGTRKLYINSIEQHILSVLPSYFHGLNNVGAPPPFSVMITIEGVYSTVCTVQDGRLYVHNPPLIERPVLFLPECLINEYGAEIDYQRAMKPAFDTLWNAANYPSAQLFSEDGQWIENWRGQ